MPNAVVAIARRRFDLLWPEPRMASLFQVLFIVKIIMQVVDLVLDHLLGLGGRRASGRPPVLHRRSAKLLTTLGCLLRRGCALRRYC